MHAVCMGSRSSGTPIWQLSGALLVAQGEEGSPQQPTSPSTAPWSSPQSVLSKHFAKTLRSALSLSCRVRLSARHGLAQYLTHPAGPLRWKKSMTDGNWDGCSVTRPWLATSPPTGRITHGDESLCREPTVPKLSENADWWCGSMVTASADTLASDR